MPDPTDLRSFSGPWPTQRSVERRHRCKIRYANGFQRNIFIGSFVPLERTYVLERPPFLSLCYAQWSGIQYVSYRVWEKFYRFNPSNTWNFLQQKEALKRKKNKKRKIKIKKKIKKTSSWISNPFALVRARGKLCSFFNFDSFVLDTLHCESHGMGKGKIGL